MANTIIMGGNRLDSSENARLEGDETRIPVPEDDPPVTVCIAAGCRYEDNPALVLCCDERGNRATVSADDSYKIRWINDALAILLAGSRTAADELYWAINTAVRSWGASDQTDEIDITKFKKDLEWAAHLRKRELMDRYTRLNVGLNFEEFLQRAKTVLSEGHYLEAWADLRAINLEAELIVASFGQDEPVIMRITADAKVYWEDHFSTIGSGGPIAEAFLVQRDYDDEMPLSECIARVMEAKVAVEKHRFVGPTIVIEVMVTKDGNSKRYVLTDEAFDAYDRAVHSRLEKPTSVRFKGVLLEELPSDEPEEPV